MGIRHTGCAFLCLEGGTDNASDTGFSGFELLKLPEQLAAAGETLLAGLIPEIAFGAVIVSEIADRKLAGHK